MRKLPGLVSLALLASATAQADEPTNTFMLYGLGIAIDGQATVGPLTADIHQSFSDVLDHLEFAAMGSYRWDSDSWSFQTDAIFASLAGEASGTLTRTTLDLDQLMLEADGGYKFNKNVELIFGLRYWDFTTKINVYGAGPIGLQASSRTDKSWVDPLVGLRLVAPINDKWRFTARGDVGGFGIGSDFAWSVTAFFDYRLGQHFSMALGYRVFDFNFDDRGGNDNFQLDMQESGPGIGVAYTF